MADKLTFNRAAMRRILNEASADTVTSLAQAIAAGTRAAAGKHPAVVAVDHGPTASGRRHRAAVLIVDANPARYQATVRAALARLQA